MHFTVLARDLAASGREHAGLVIVWSLQNNAFTDIVDGVERVLRDRPEQGSWTNLVLTL